MQLPGLYTGAAPAWVNITRQYNSNLGRFIERISERYFSVYGNCFIPQPLVVRIKGGKYFLQFARDVFASNWTIPEASEAPLTQVSQCLLRSSSVKLIAVVIWRVSDITPVGHAQLLIINKIAKAMELYDSNGLDILQYNYPDAERVLKKVRHFLKLSYAITPLQESNTKYGLQAYESQVPHCYGVAGFCATWVFYYAELRARNASDSAAVFRDKMQRRISALYDAGLHLGRYFYDIVIDYLTEVDNMIRPAV